jgi:probable rRNA maturation factor
MISILINNSKGFKIDEEKIKLAILKTLKKHKAKQDLEISVVFLSKKEILKLNKDYRGINKPTCVLSFGQEESEAEKSGQAYSNENFKNIFFPEIKGKRRLGDIVICPEVAKEKNYSLSFLASHATEHLLGIHHEHSDLSFKIQTKKNSRARSS